MKSVSFREKPSQPRSIFSPVRPTQAPSAASGASLWASSHLFLARRSLSSGSFSSRAGLSVLVPRGTNTAKPGYAPTNEEDTWMTARNKWLLAHPESNEAKNGAHIGLKGLNIDIKEDL